ncbi:MAG: hypothetical protein NUV45_06435 [Tepidanaerobacteraceae bacterium]|nr:hypothetical protein [Tepidanaerobacteraceae bacterium]
MTQHFNPGKVCDILKSLYEKAEAAKTELELSGSDRILTRREEGLKNYARCLREYLERYNNIKEGLLEFTDKEKLLDFIIEQAASDPAMLIDLAHKIGVVNSWGGIPIRGYRE